MSNANGAKRLDGIVHSEKERSELPHLYGRKWYDWAWEFFDSKNEMSFLCAANQISKSSTMIRKAIHWATDKSLWPKLWNHEPGIFWYWYPDSNVATIEFKKKWIKEFMPSGDMKDHPDYGWSEVYEYKKIKEINFNSGVTIYFKTYKQDVVSVQTTSVDAMFVDEEMPVGVYDEAIQRLGATEGYFNMVFTATMGQAYWYRVIEERGKPKEELKDAFKRQVSKYDCLYYMDGTPSPWTIERIQKDEKKCRNQDEIDKRVHGRFIMDTNRLIGSFNKEKNLKTRVHLRPGWIHRAGVFFSRSNVGRKTSIVVVRTNANMTMGEVIHSWNGGDEDALDVYIALKKITKGLELAGCYAPVEAKDFIRLASSSGTSIQSMKIPKDNGEKLVNSLFRSGILNIVDRDSNSQLIQQIQSCKRADDLLIDYENVGALIAAVTELSWNFSEVLKDNAPPRDPYEHMDERMRWYKGIDRPELNQPEGYEHEFQEANEYYNIEETDDF